MTSATVSPDGANGNKLPVGDVGGETAGLRKSLTAAGSAGYAGSSASPNAIRSGRPGSGLSLSVLELSSSREESLVFAAGSLRPTTDEDPCTDIVRGVGFRILSAFEGRVVREQ
uniref:Uncharacterized protein n=1 Tax=Anopheles farauti TaxID=69004 RepID=A0A182Q1N8_9DIPT